jgi:3-hydroxyacyl-CoA dehydrogenase/enoyl-CoA hydratase/3-hydroxybutyryl-CoA epimerase
VIDGAMIFGAGFAPFRGGPLHYARQRGAADIRKALDTLTWKYGERFQADRGWDALD